MARVTGILVTTGAVVVVNRPLPTNMPHHGGLQEAMFWLTWLATLVHASIHSGAKTSKDLSPPGASSLSWSWSCREIQQLRPGAF